MSTRNLRVMSALFCGLSISGSALAQVPVAGAPAVAAAPAPEPAPEAPTPAVASDAPKAPPFAVPPGFMLVPIPDAAPKTHYDVQYPQGRGALPPGMELPYEDGDRVPPGYRLRQQPRRGLVIGGSIMVGVPWTIGLTAAVGDDFKSKSGLLLVPGVGPWLMLLAGGAKDRSCDASGSDFCSSRSGLRAALTLDGLVQTAGAAMFVAGLMLPRKRLVREDVTVSLAPSPVGRDGYGLGAIGTF